MKRKDFIKSTIGASLGSLTLGQSALNKTFNKRKQNSVIANISQVNDRNVEQLLANIEQRASSSGGHRGKSGFMLNVSAAYCSEYSSYYHDDDLIQAMQLVADSLLETQYPDGTWTGGNLQSPPDSAFAIEQLYRVQALLIRDNHSQTSTLQGTLSEVIHNTCEALIVGGVHTPNHRWAICAALAGTNDIYPDQRYVDRINDWLGEGIGQDEDGEHPERSRNYDCDVNNPSLLEVAIYQKRDELFEVVRKNLNMTMYLLNAADELESISSRRQDQSPSGNGFPLYRFYLPYRYMAIKDNNGQFASIANTIETKYMDRLGSHLADFLLHEELNSPLPTLVTPPENYVKHLTSTKMVRIRRKDISVSIFGGTDWYLGHKAWSGLSHNPTFFKLRKGGAVLESVRMSPSFFSTGYFRSEGLEVNGNTYKLSEHREVPYHLPLPERFRRPDGIYPMSPDGRFFSRMDFGNRPKQMKELLSEVTIREIGEIGKFELEISVDESPDISVMIELTFRRGGQLMGVMPKDGDPDGFVLGEGTGSYRVGNDVIEFGPGLIGDDSGGGFRRGMPRNEQYSVYRGNIATPDGFRVYISATSPFRHTMQIG